MQFYFVLFCFFVLSRDQKRPSSCNFAGFGSFLSQNFFLQMLRFSLVIVLIHFIFFYLVLFFFSFFLSLRYFFFYFPSSLSMPFQPFLIISFSIFLSSFLDFCFLLLWVQISSSSSSLPHFQTHVAFIFLLLLYFCFASVLLFWKICLVQVQDCSKTVFWALFWKLWKVSVFFVCLVCLPLSVFLWKHDFVGGFSETSNSKFWKTNWMVRFWTR